MSVMYDTAMLQKSQPMLLLLLLLPQQRLVAIPAPQKNATKQEHRTNEYGVRNRHVAEVAANVVAAAAANAAAVRLPYGLALLLQQRLMTLPGVAGGGGRGGGQGV
jgi:hypothetical protein